METIEILSILELIFECMLAGFCIAYFLFICLCFWILLETDTVDKYFWFD